MADQFAEDADYVRATGMTTRKSEYVLRALALDDVDKVRGAAIRAVNDLLPLARDGQHAAEHGRLEVAAEYLERIGDGLEALVKKVKELSW